MIPLRRTIRNTYKEIAKVGEVAKLPCNQIIPEDKLLTSYIYWQIKVEADFSKPVIHIDAPLDACGPTPVTVSCSSYGGYPKPNMTGSINNKTIEWDYSYITDDKQLLNVSGTYKLNVTEDLTVQCAIHYPSFQESTKTFGIPNKCPPPPPPPYEIVIISIMILIFLVTLIALITFFRHPACKHLQFSTYTKSHQPVTRIEMVPQKCSGEIRGQAD